MWVEPGSESSAHSGCLLAGKLAGRPIRRCPAALQGQPQDDAGAGVAARCVTGATSPGWTSQELQAVRHRSSMRS